MDPKSLMKTAGWLMAVNALMHLSAPLPAGGLHPDAVQLMPGGALYALFAWGLLSGLRWVAYLTFVITLIGANVALSAMGASALPAWWMGAIALLDVAAAGLLFLALWQNNPKPAA